MNTFITKCPFCGSTGKTGEMLPLEIMELNNLKMQCGMCDEMIPITKETFIPYNE